MKIVAEKRPAQDLERRWTSELVRRIAAADELRPARIAGEIERSVEGATTVLAPPSA